MDIALPGEGGRSTRYRLVGLPAQPVIGARFSRIAYAAAHVVADPL
ncbi:MAG: dihydrodipicolinate synthase family protein, partial [Mesorhizobium sp.]